MQKIGEGKWLIERINNSPDMKSNITKAHIQEHCVTHLLVDKIDQEEEKKGKTKIE